MKIVWTELAVNKFEEFADFIAVDDPNSAIKWTETILEAVNKLQLFSPIGREVPEIKK